MKTMHIKSDNGDFEVNDELIIRVYEDDDMTVVTLFSDDEPVFSMGIDELSTFADTMHQIDQLPDEQP